jgi:hypothetical protein
MQEERLNWDKIGASMNSINTKTLLNEADVVVVRFGEKYRQWNAAFDAGYAAALGKPIITLHPPAISHMLKEINASSCAVCEDPQQVVDTLAYVIRGDLLSPHDGEKLVTIADRVGKRSYFVRIIIYVIFLHRQDENIPGIYIPNDERWPRYVG